MESLPIELFIKIIQPEPSVGKTKYMICRNWYNIAIDEMKYIHELNRKKHKERFADCLAEINLIHYELNNVYTLIDYKSVRQYKNIATTYTYKRNIYVISEARTHHRQEKLDVTTIYYMYGSYSTSFKSLPNKTKRNSLKLLFKDNNCDVKYENGYLHGIKNNIKSLFYEIYTVKSISEILYHEYFRVLEKIIF